MCNKRRYDIKLHLTKPKRVRNNPLTLYRPDKRVTRTNNNVCQAIKRHKWISKYNYEKKIKFDYLNLFNILWIDFDNEYIF
jgi:hypothetical protein